MKPVAAAHALIDRYMAAASEGSEALGHPVRCGKGCFHCCREPVQAERREAQHIVEAIPPGDLPAVRERVAHWWDSFHAHGLEKAPPPREQDGSQLARYLSKKLWCPLLDGGLCCVYDRRPTGCRMHAAIGSPARCADDETRKRQKFMQTEQEPEVVLMAMGEMCEFAPQALFEYDHLGVWLAHLLLGKTGRSNAATDVMVSLTEPK